MPNALFSHYSLLLDLKEPWKVSDVDLQVERSRVEIHVEYGGSKTCCPKCANACRVKDHAHSRQVNAMMADTTVFFRFRLSRVM